MALLSSSWHKAFHATAQGKSLLHSTLPPWAWCIIIFNSKSSKSFLRPKGGRTEVIDDKGGAVESFGAVLEPGSANGWLWKSE